MIISDFLFISGLVCLFILVCAIITVLVKKIWNTYLGVPAGLVIAGTGIVMIVARSAKLYVVTEENELKSYHAFGTFTMKGKFGMPIDCRISGNKTGVISYSSDTLLIREMIYQGSPSYPPPIGDEYVIKPYIFNEVSLKMGMIDYAFDEKIPDKFTANIGNQTSLYWIKVR